MYAIRHRTSVRSIAPANLSRAWSLVLSVFTVICALPYARRAKSTCLIGPTPIVYIAAPASAMIAATRNAT